MQRTGRRDGHSPITTNSSRPHPALAEQPACCSRWRTSAIIWATAGYLLGGSGGYGGPTFLWRVAAWHRRRYRRDATWAGWMAAHRSGTTALMTNGLPRLLAGADIDRGWIAKSPRRHVDHGEAISRQHAPSAMQRWFGLSGAAWRRASLARSGGRVFHPGSADSGRSVRRAATARSAAGGQLRLDTPRGSARAAATVRDRARGASESEYPRIWLPVTQARDAAWCGRNYLPPAEAAVIPLGCITGRHGDAKLGELDISARRLAGDRGGGGPGDARRTIAAGRECPLAHRQAVAAAIGWASPFVPLGERQPFRRGALHLERRRSFRRHPNNRRHSAACAADCSGSS